MKRITVEELNEHYFQATGRYTLEVKGILSVEFETEKLNDPDITDEQIEDAILNGEHTVEVTERDVAFEVVDNG